VVRRHICKQLPSATSIFVYDGLNLTETVNGAGGLVARYAQGPGVDQPLAMQRGSTTDYYEQDALGSVTSLTAANGSIAQTYTYDSFGNTTNSSGSLTNFFRYTGREFDTETNLYYYRARYYDPTPGRFASEDPIRFWAGNDFYRYVSNRPVYFGDPRGYCPPPGSQQSPKKSYSGCVAGTVLEDGAWGGVGMGVIALAGPPVIMGVAGSSVGPEGTVEGAGLGLGVGVAIAPEAALGGLFDGMAAGLLHGLISCAFQ
jgi:RHS repeat-associated protein